MVEENFEIWLPGIPQNSLISLFYFIALPSPWLKKNMKFDFPKLFRIILSYFVSLHSHTFTVVEENVEIGLSEMPQNSLILLFLFIPSAWLRSVEILHSETPKNSLVLRAFETQESFLSIFNISKHVNWVTTGALSDNCMEMIINLAGNTNSCLLGG